MSYAPYAAITDWQTLSDGCPEDEATAERWLRRASRDIDTLTFNRIVATGFDNLTEFQQELVREAVCQLAEWEQENAQLLDSPMSGYTINGVTAQFGESSGVTVTDGVTVPNRLLALLEQTGLCHRGVW
ncbi:MAG: hypothetical protein LUG58_01150 [Clostridiales bacterium]|nr:hypothetical protein [Clostridiales bacterium]